MKRGKKPSCSGKGNAPRDDSVQALPPSHRYAGYTEGYGILQRMQSRELLGRPGTFPGSGRVRRRPGRTANVLRSLTRLFRIGSQTIEQHGKKPDRPCDELSASREPAGFLRFGCSCFDALD